MKLLNKLQILATGPYGLVFMLLLIGILAYGIHLPWMGFYWDDWPRVWFSHNVGPRGMFEIDALHRPISGLILYLGELLSGGQPLGWQIYNFLFRILGSISLAWMLLSLWPKSREQINWVVALFLVYPGFGQQFVAVNTSRHLLPLVTFFISLGFMTRAIQSRNRYWEMTGAALILLIITMLTTEYYYGLEFIRPLLSWIIVRHQDKKLRETLKVALYHWLPYLIVLVLIFAWRFSISRNVNYQITLFDELSGEPAQNIIQHLMAAIQDIVSAGFSVWGKIFQFPDPNVFGGRSKLYFWGVVILAMISVLLFFISNRSKPAKTKWGYEAMILGSGALMVGPIPFWVTGLDIKLSFPFDRLTLPMMMGSSLLLAGFLAIAIRNRGAKIALFALIVGLGVGNHFQNGVTYRIDWFQQRTFFQQLLWRIPGLKPNTAILSNELPTTYSTDNSLIAPLNWIYAPGLTDRDLSVFLFYVDLRFNDDHNLQNPDSLVKKGYLNYSFKGSLDQVLVLYNQPPACTRVLSDEFHHNFPGLPPEIKSVLTYSNLDQILDSSNEVLKLPFHTNLSGQEKDWCYYFEKADLARQNSAWEAVADFGDKALEVGFPDSPTKHATEYELFIEGYAHTIQWQKAVQLTLAARESNPQVIPMLCDTWDRIRSSTPITAESSNTQYIVFEKLRCPITE